MTIGERIREKIRQKGISQNQLARLAQISQSGLSSIINGASSPKENTMKAIAAALGRIYCGTLRSPAQFLHLGPGSRCGAAHHGGMDGSRGCHHDHAHL